MKWIKELFENKYIQIYFFGMYLIFSGMLIGYGDIIQNYGSPVNPPNFWLGFLAKLFGFIMCILLIKLLTKDYKPYLLLCSIKSKEDLK